MLKELAIATRFYGLSKQDRERLAVWVDAALCVVKPENIFVAINTEVDLAKGLYFMHNKYPKVNAFAVTPWGKVVQAPNALLMKSAEKRMKYLLFVSTEYPVTKSVVSSLYSHWDNKTLVVGVSLKGHDMKADKNKKVLVKSAGGLQIPWNTYALWSIERLVHTGFVLAADSLEDPDNAGMEEMGTIAAQQILWPGRALAKLIVPCEDNIAVNTYGWSVKRHDRYMKNLQSKNSRSADQLKRLSLPTPEVLHIGLKK